MSSNKRLFPEMFDKHLVLKKIPKNIFNFSILKKSLSLFQKINNLGNFFKNVLRAVSAILGGYPTCIALNPICFAAQHGTGETEISN